MSPRIEGAAAPAAGTAAAAAMKKEILRNKNEFKTKRNWKCHKLIVYARNMGEDLVLTDLVWCHQTENHMSHLSLIIFYQHATCGLT